MALLSTVKLPGFIFLNVCQFFTAGNDNILKQVLIFGVAAGGIWTGTLGEGAQAYASLCLSIPFVVFSGFAGQFADRYSKREVCVVVKWAEVFIAILALWGFWQFNVWIVLLSLILISTQSTFFTPAKFGLLPELVEEQKLSRANGTLNMFTYIAIIFGSALGGPIYDAYAPNPEQHPNAAGLGWLPGMVVLVVAIAGLIFSWGIPRTTAKNPQLRINFRLFKTYIDTWRSISGTAVATVIVAWSFYYMIVGGIAILILPDYKSLLQISATQATALLAVLGIATGIGDFAAGQVSRNRIRPELIPFGAIGTAVMFAILGLIPLNFGLVCGALALTGFLAGFVMVPLQTMTQEFSQEKERGQVLGLWNCMSFVGIIVGNMLFLIVRLVGVPSNRVFIVCSVLGAAFTICYFARWRRQFWAELAGHLPVSK